MKRLFKWLGVALAVPFVLVALLMILIYLPPVQRLIVQEAIVYASNATGMDIHIDRLRLTPLLDLDVQGVSAIDSIGDTLVATKRIIIDLDLADILDRRIGVSGLRLDGVQLNTKDMIASTMIRGSLERILVTDDIDLTAQHVAIANLTARAADVEVLLRDTTVIDTTKSEPLEWTFSVVSATISDSRVCLQQEHRDTLGTAALTTIVEMDSLSLEADSLHLDLGLEHIAVQHARLMTAHSKLDAWADMDFNAFTPGSGGHFDGGIATALNKVDIMRLAGNALPESFAKAYPDRPLHVRLNATGNIDNLVLTRLEAALPGSLYADASGNVSHVMDSVDMGGRVDFNVKTEDINWVKQLAGGALDGIELPSMQIGGTAKANGTRYETVATLTQGDGSMLLRADIDTRGAMTYNADIGVNGLQLRHFMPKLPISPLTAHAKVSGSGTDFMKHGTRLDATVSIKQCTYESYDLSATALDAHVANGSGHARIAADSPLLKMQADVNALLGKKTDATCTIDLGQADLHALGLVDYPMKVALCAHVDFSTDFKRHHYINGGINDIILMPRDSVFRPEDITLEALLEPDTTYAYVSSGDLSLRMHGHTGYDRLLGQLGHFTDELNRQIEARTLNEDALVKRLPQIDLRIASGEHNPAHDILAAMGYAFTDLRFGINLDPMIGINGGGHIYSLNTGSILLDTIQAHIYRDSTAVRMDARVRNNRRNPQFTFDARFNGSITPDGVAAAHIEYYDDRGNKGVDFGIQGAVNNDSLQLHLNPYDPIIAYRTFHINPDNYITLTKGNRVDANLDLTADDGTGLKVYTTPNAEVLQDISVSINHLNIGELSSVLPYLPKMAGILHGDAHLIHTEKDMSVATDLNIDDMRYQGAPLGQVGLQAVYLPNSDGSHFVDGSLLHTGMPVATFTGCYKPANQGKADAVADESTMTRGRTMAAGEELDVDVALDRLPFALANGFLPDAMARLEGLALGDIHIGGTTTKPRVDGELITTGLKVLSDQYSLNLRVADDTLRVNNSLLDLDRIAIYSTGKNPFTMNGTINFADLNNILLDATMRAKDFELINSKKTAKSLAYGKVYVDFDSNVKGSLDDLKIFGQLKVLSKTDLTYILTDSPLTADDQLEGLVEFVDFTDTLNVEVPETRKPQHINIAMNIEIGEATQVHCLLSPDASSYVNIEGGGELMMTYSQDKDLQLTGRYTVNSGTLKYTMMVIPLKEFSIKRGSYVEFRGPITNPVLNIKATERMRTTVTENNQPRSVNFEVGLNITQTLENLGLEFMLDAPEDLTIQSDLATMSAEQRGRLAVTMLATGMYINDAGATTSGGATGQNALNAFLQGQISNITGKALKSVDISMGVEQGTSATGGATTDYSFRFAKRFWGNRISIIVGGKVSTGENAVNTGESIIDNVSIEYRLDEGASRYVNVFYDKNYESVLDGVVTEMGAGLVLRRKTQRLGELFLFKKKELTPVTSQDKEGNDKQK